MRKQWAKPLCTPIRESLLEPALQKASHAPPVGRHEEPAVRHAWHWKASLPRPGCAKDPRTRRRGPRSRHPAPHGAICRPEPSSGGCSRHSGAPGAPLGRRCWPPKSKGHVERKKQPKLELVPICLPRPFRQWTPWVPANSTSQFPTSMGDGPFAQESRRPSMKLTNSSRTSRYFTCTCSPTPAALGARRRRGR